MRSFSVQKAAIAALALLSIAYYVATTAGDLGRTTFDDAYITTRYAKHWIAGQGFSWNPADGPAFGVTSPAYLVVITAAMRVTGCSDAAALTGVSFTAGLLAVLALVLVGFFVQERRWSEKNWLPLLVVPSILLIPPFRYHNLTGMETTFSLFSNALVALAIVIAVRWRSTPALVFCLVAGALSLAARPDNGIYALFLPPAVFVSADRSLWRYARNYALVFAGIIGLGLVLNKLLFGDLVPLPFFVKSAHFYQGYIGAAKWNAMKETLGFWTAALPAFLLLVSTLRRRTVPQVATIAVAIALTFGYFATVTQVMGWETRYYYPSLAFCFLAAFLSAAAAGGAGGALATPSSPATAWRLLAGVVVLVLALSAPIKESAASLWEKHVIGTPRPAQVSAQYRMPKTELPQLRWWQSIVAMGDLLNRMPRGTVFASSEYGIIGSRFPNMPIVDLVGLNDRTIAHHGFSAAYVLSRRPDLIWFPHSDYTRTIASILDDPVFQRDYEYFPGAYDYGIALRKTSDKYPAIRMELERQFARIYPGIRLSDDLAEPPASAYRLAPGAQR